MTEADPHTTASAASVEADWYEHDDDECPACGPLCDCDWDKYEGESPV
jgi:hypothetical protein